jgi:ferritin
MRLSPKMLKALNDQIHAEMHSAYLYFAMAADFASGNFEGFAGWMRVQAQEEMGHALRFCDYVLERGGRIALQKLDAPPATWESPLAVYKAALAHEEHITQRIHDLVALAAKEHDPATVNFLQWFVNEQVEEESNVTKVVEKLEMVGPSTNGLLMLDHRIGEKRAK